MADEQVITGKCERCGSEVEKKDLEQWFFKITDYAERLLNNIEDLDWSEKVKIAQRQWIGRSEGAEMEFRIQNSEFRIKVFTTRPDTLFGATFMVLSPEHDLSKQIAEKNKAIADYIKTAQSKTEQERITEGKEKTGIDTGLLAINPVNGEGIPVWIADYVLMGYGTGAIMAVPAHDSRDYEFAKKYNLPIKPVIRPINSSYMGYVKRVWSKDFDKFVKELKKLDVIFKEETKDSVIYEVKKENLQRFIEIAKESVLRNAWHDLVGKELIVIFGDGEIASIELFEENKTVWEKMKALEETVRKYSGIWEMLYESVYQERMCYLGSGEVINSGKDWEDYYVPDAIPKMIDDLEKKGIGKRKVQYHLRDWLISRQRYWGPPIPLVFCENCAQKIKKQETRSRKQEDFNKGEIENPGWVTISERDLPVLLPDVKDWKPMGAGKSPLATIEDFVKTTCPKCGGEAKRETDVSDTFLDSAWYFFRYISTDGKETAFNKQRVEKWLPVNMYIGGAEHSVLHLLYSRFITMVFKDLGLISFEEPYSKFRAHGLLIKEGAKMSKSRGNVVIPDEYIKKFGADTLRMYLMFLGPFTQGGGFYDTGIEGMHRFVKRLWTLSSKVILREAKDPDSSARFAEASARRAKPQNNNSQRVMHKTIKKVTEDIENLRYNTAIASMMEYYNFLSNQQTVSKDEIKSLILLLCPFSPHVSEELWNLLGFKKSIHKSSWPVFKEEYLVEKSTTIIIQINGKVRDTLKADLADINDKQKIEETAKESQKVKKYLNNKTI